MMNNYIKMKRKGITPIIAIVLLLMMTVAAFGMTFVWVQKTQGEIQDGVSDEVTNMMGKNAAQFSIESVYNDSTGGLIAVIIRNSGTYSFSDGSQFKIYVDGLPTTHDNKRSIHRNNNARGLQLSSTNQHDFTGNDFCNSRLHLS